MRQRAYQLRLGAGFSVPSRRPFKKLHEIFHHSVRWREVKEMTEAFALSRHRDKPAGSLSRHRAATVSVRDSQDHFIAELQRQGRWTGWAAAMAAISVVFQAFDRLMQ